jgi:hypothetical protein
MITGLQAAQVGLVSQLQAWRSHFAPREYAVLIDLLARWLERESRRTRIRPSRVEFALPLDVFIARVCDEDKAA